MVSEEAVFKYSQVMEYFLVVLYIGDFSSGNTLSCADAIGDHQSANNSNSFSKTNILDWTLQSTQLS